jgi:hypothetical protein
VPAASTIVVMGPSGSSKTTLGFPAGGFGYSDSPKTGRLALISSAGLMRQRSGRPQAAG